MGSIDNGINLVHLGYIRAGAGRMLIGSRQWIPAEQISALLRRSTTGLPLEPRFATKGEPASDLPADAWSDGVCLDFVAGDEVYGACTTLRTFPEEHGQAWEILSGLWDHRLPGMSGAC
ncbi:hypothetical protein H4W80_007286 [Nonomuraea angiospora]|uniref:Uncharacterized protein n=1 Tax=Nonomuraea angiospora TaxID=46172 RepID=A0ABR9M7Z5_9ACTN|nr:hypothetical protein [Nonomuraea angiospora]